MLENLKEKEFSRKDRLNGHIKKTLAKIIKFELKDPRIGLVSVNEVRLSNDIRNAKVYISILGSENKQKEIFQVLLNAKKYIRHCLSKKVALRYTPELKFYLDDTYNYKDKINNLINLEKAKIEKNTGFNITPNIEEKLKNAYQYILENDNFLLFAHNKPDGDALGALLSMYIFLTNIDKKVKIYSDYGAPEYLKWMPYSENIITDKNKIKDYKYENLILLDSLFNSRVGFLYNFLIEKSKLLDNFIVFDHHPGEHHEKFGLIYEHVSSTSEIIYNFFKTNDIIINDKIALCLYIGILTDTYMLSQANTYSSTFQTVSDLVKHKNIDIYKINFKLFERKTLAQTKLLSKMLNSLKITENKKIGYAYISQKDFKDSNATDEDTEGLINHIRAIEGVIVAVIFRELDEKTIKVNMRSKEDFDLLPIVKKNNGGGHRKAAGFNTEIKAGVVEKLINEIQDYLK